MLLDLVHKGKKKKQPLLIVFPRILILLLVLFTSVSTHNVTSFICIGSLDGNDALDLFKANFHNLSLNLIKFYGNLSGVIFLVYMNFIRSSNGYLNLEACKCCCRDIFFFLTQNHTVKLPHIRLEGLLMKRKMKGEK